MYGWYSDAQVCYAFLSDVSPLFGVNADPRRLGSPFRRSKWFTRGWTLQELLAPKNLIFFDRYWGEIGTKSTLKDLLGSITGVKDDHLFDICSASVAQKMSWAALRETTRVEDQAYCLMGLFQVNMPPLYGEGKQAFMRLQSEILRMTDDVSIFAWADNRDSWNVADRLGLLAQSPAAFLGSGDIVPDLSSNFEFAYSMTNRGLQMEVPFIVDADRGDWSASGIGAHLPQDEPLILVPLACRLNGTRLAIHLRSNSGSKDQFYRCPGQTPLTMTTLYSNNKAKAGHEMKTLYVTQYEHNGGVYGRRIPTPTSYPVIINTGSLQDYGYRVLQQHYYKDNEAKWERVAENSLDLANVPGEAEVIWKPRYGVTSLLIIFKKGKDRFSLQIFTDHKRAGLKIVTAQHRQNQDRESIFWEHVSSLDNEGDRALKPLLDGGQVSASVKNAAVYLRRNIEAPEQRSSGESFQLLETKEPVHMVSITMHTRTSRRPGYGATTGSSQPQRNSASNPDGDSRNTWARGISLRHSVQGDHPEYRSDNDTTDTWTRDIPLRGEERRYYRGWDRR